MLLNIVYAVYADNIGAQTISYIPHILDDAILGII